MVWVNPPNRVNYTVITRLRNVHSRKLSEFDATHLQNVQPTTTIKVAEIPPSKRGKSVIPSEVEESRGKTYNDSTGSFDSAALRPR
jgi:hypothetical protein